MDKIQLLDTNLLKKEELFKEITYWKDLLGIKIGWSYMLDFIWQLDRFNSLNLPKGSLILDAGAGNGLLQYILSARGYNVISVQSSWRTKHINEISRIVRPGGIVMCFGWNSSGIGKKRAFELIEILLVAHGGIHNDTIITVERKNIKL